MHKKIKVLLLFFIFIFIFSGCGAYNQLISSREKADLNKIYGISNDQAAVFVNNELADDPAIVEKEEIYFSFDLVYKFIDKRFYWDKNDSKLLFTDAEAVNEINIDNKDICILKNDDLYLTLKCLKEYLNINTSIYNNPSRIYIDTAKGTKKIVTVTKKTELRVLGGYKSDIITEVKKDAEVTVITEHDNWIQVRTEDGFIGYVPSDTVDIDNASVVKIKPVKKDSEHIDIKRDKKICLAWQDMENVSGNKQFDAFFSKTKGVNVVSPAWFQLKDNKGSYRNLSSKEYVKKAHDKGMEVWILADDFSDQMSIGKVLGNTKVRQQLVKDFVYDTKKVGADGINIDFEYISDSCGRDYIQFLRELSIACHENELVFSVDNANPTFIKYCYDIEEQGKIADYIILMGYDEHWQGSEAGSVSSLPFVEDGVAAALKMVSADKIISGLPFYTRVWTEIPEEYASANAKIREDSNSEYERYSLSSVALSMPDIQNMISKAGVKESWNDELGQNYVEIPLEHGKQRIWVEDIKSLKEKINVASDNSLAGIAFWKIGMEDNKVWDIVLDYMK